MAHYIFIWCEVAVVRSVSVSSLGGDVRHQLGLLPTEELIAAMPQDLLLAQCAHSHTSGPETAAAARICTATPKVHPATASTHPALRRDRRCQERRALHCGLPRAGACNALGGCARQRIPSDSEYRPCEPGYREGPAASRAGKCCHSAR
jgi:hypothetical protein